MAIPPAFSYLRVDRDGHVIVDIHVIPNAARTQIDGLHDGALRVRLKAPPVDGKANQAVVAWLADTLEIPRAQITLLRGQTSKRKQFCVQAGCVERARWVALAAQ